MDHIFDAVKNRTQLQSKFGYGITTADTYLKHIQACAGEGVCSASNPWAQVANAPEWGAVVKEAGNKLVYSNDETVVKQETVTTNSSDFKASLSNKDTVVPPKTIMVFRNVVTTPKKDRDGDILRTGGAEIDDKMPLLWQHMHVAPIGRMIEVVDHNKNELVVTSAIIDSALGKDTANLVEFGALRISHGFLPKEFKELEQNDGEMPGYDITKFEIMEESVVSVPSNTDAIIEAVSRGKLADPLVKSWAQHYFDNRPIIVSGVDMSQLAQDSEKQIQSISEDDEKITIVLDKGEQSQGEADAEDENEPEQTQEAEADSGSGCGCGKTNDRAIEIKAGRTLSKANEQRLADAKELIDEVSSAPSGEVKSKYKAMAKEATRMVGEVLAQSGGDDGDEEIKSDAPSHPGLEDIAKQLLVMSQDGDPYLLKRLALVLGETADAKIRQQQDEDFKSAIAGLL